MELLIKSPAKRELRQGKLSKNGNHMKNTNHNKNYDCAVRNTRTTELILSNID